MAQVRLDLSPLDVVLMKKDKGARAFVMWLGLAALFMSVAVGAQTLTAPKYKFDPTWPKPMPNKWKIGGVTGLAVDKDDNVWVLDRPNNLRDMELKAELDPPTAA